jgi:hypothetical protein
MLCIVTHDGVSRSASLAVMMMMIMIMMSNPAVSGSRELPVTEQLALPAMTLKFVDHYGNATTMQAAPVRVQSPDVNM